MSAPFQYTLKDLFWTVTLVGLGLGGLISFYKQKETPQGVNFLWLVCGVISCTALGAGVYAPFKKKVRGASLVIVAFLILIGAIVCVGLLDKFAFRP